VTSGDQAHTAVQALVHSQLVPAAVELTWEFTVGASDPDGRGVVAAEFEGHIDGAGACAQEAATLLGGDAASGVEPPPWWGREPEDPQSDGVLVRCAVAYELAHLPALLEALADVAEHHRAGAVLRGSAGVGAVQVALHGDPDGVVGAIGALRDAATRFGGSVVVRDAPPEVRTRLDVWGPVGGLELMRAVKAQFDPSRLLAPGRFVGGI
jgi:glycolate oxidase FAD binding subunit